MIGPATVNAFVLTLISWVFVRLPTLNDDNVEGNANQPASTLCPNEAVFDSKTNAPVVLVMVGSIPTAVFQLNV